MRKMHKPGFIVIASCERNSSVSFILVVNTGLCILCPQPKISLILQCLRFPFNIACLLGNYKDGSIILTENRISFSSHKIIIILFPFVYFLHRQQYKLKNYEDSLLFVEEALKICRDPGLEEMADKIRSRIASQTQ